jgi:spore germination protein YaaH
MIKAMLKHWRRWIFSQKTLSFWLISSLAAASLFLFITRDDSTNDELAENLPKVEEERIRYGNDPVPFKEIWGYMLRGEEKSFKGTEPVTDIFYFSCDVNSKGRININIKPPKLPKLDGKRRKVHIVISELENYSLMQRVLRSDSSLRDYLIDDILEVAEKFDGVQIDFESVPFGSAADFHKFLSIIKLGLDNGKILSVALPPRRRSVPGDPYDYKKISEIADRVYVMAYDQHWSTSNPGPVASLSWCRDIVRYAAKTIPESKLVMGIPLYGRAWYDRNSSCAIMAKHVPILLNRKTAISQWTFEYGLKISFSDSRDIIFYDDIQALREKFFLYKRYVDSIGFWRLGMEERALWNEISLNKNF